MLVRYIFRNPFNKVRFLSNLVNLKDNIKCERETIFLNPKVQEVLKLLTGYDEKKIFFNKPNGYAMPKFLFLTDEELKLTLERVKSEGMKLLQMPPVMEPTKDEPQILSVNPELKGFSKCNHVFIDISKGFTERTRLIVTRQTDGVLRRANRDERHRMNYIHFPVKGKSYEIPKMFIDDNLEEVLNKFEYEFILDRACIQFEPDDPMFVETAYKTYEHILETKKFNLLKSTRHFGPMVFYYAYENKIDFLLIYYIENRLVSDAASLVKLYYLVKGEEITSDDNLTVIKKFMVEKSRTRHILEPLVNSLENSSGNAD